MTRSGRQDSPHVTFLTRLPEPGHVKTRLGVTLGPERAAQLHDEVARHCFRMVLPIAATKEARLSVSFSAEAGGSRDVRRWLDAPHAVRVRRQRDGDLGDRILGALEDGLEAGASGSFAVGSDCPGLDAPVMRRAIGLLERADCVLGPAADGGYYLIGVTPQVRDRLPGLFDRVPWGDDDVLAHTLGRISDMGLEAELLETLHDIDREEDLAVWDSARDAERLGREARVSAIIPALDEEGEIVGAVESAVAAGVTEVIVVDGGSDDGTRDAARRSGALVVESPAGRATQMNAGADAACSEALVFLHADTRLPEGGATAVLAALSEPSVAGGGFAFASHEPDRRSRMLAAGARMRSSWTRHPYGDQALFVRARDFERLGGYPEMPTMEDWELVRRLKRLGDVVVLDERAETSTRSFLEHGFARGLAVNAAVIAGYAMGTDVERLAGWRSRVNTRAAG